MNKKTLAIACCFICLQCCLHAQVMLQSNFPQIGMVQKNQLWSLSIINGSNILYQCKLGLVVKNRSTNEEMLVANSALFSLPMGTKQVQLNTIAPVSNNYTHPDFNKQNNLLPIGSYTVCYTLDAVAPKEINLAEECFQLDIEPLSPPLLSLPADSAILETNTNQFTWIPPAPVNLFSNLQYDIVITEIMDGQKATEAIQENLPIYTVSNLLSPTFNLPTTANKLTKDKWYAWQIVAKDNDNYAGKSETWVFKLIEPKPKILTASQTFIELQNNQEPGGITYINGKTVNVKFHSYEAASKSTINIIDAKGRIIQKKQIDILPGDNYISIDLHQAIKTANVYQVSIKIAATKTLAASFILQ